MLRLHLSRLVSGPVRPLPILRIDTSNINIQNQTFYVRTLISFFLNLAFGLSGVFQSTIVNSISRFRFDYGNGNQAVQAGEHDDYQVRPVVFQFNFPLVHDNDPKEQRYQYADQGEPPVPDKVKL